MSEILKSIDDRYVQLNNVILSLQNNNKFLEHKLISKQVENKMLMEKVEAFDEQTEVCKRLCEENGKLDIDLTLSIKQYNQCMELIRHKDKYISEKESEITNLRNASDLLKKTYKALKEKYDVIVNTPKPIRQNYNDYIIIGGYLFIMLGYILHLNK